MVTNGQQISLVMGAWEQEHGNISTVQFSAGCNLLVIHQRYLIVVIMVIMVKVIVLMFRYLDWCFVRQTNMAVGDMGFVINSTRIAP